MAAIMLLSFAACDNGKEPVSDPVNEDVYSDIAETPDVTLSELPEETISVDSTASVTSTEPGETAAELTAALQVDNDPSKWTTEEIVEFYKQAATKSQKTAKSTQTMTMTEMVVNDGDGLIGTLVEWATPIMKAALKKNSVENDGITGGYDRLTASDVKSAKAYKSGEYTVIEMEMKEQTDGIHGDATSGTVGHAISVVGDISVVQKELPQFRIDFENSNLTLRYVNPQVKVKINKDGIIEKGTWSYIVDVDLSNLYIEAVNLPIKVTISSGYGSVDYVTKVGGGF